MDLILTSLEIIENFWSAIEAPSMPEVMMANPVSNSRNNYEESNYPDTI